MLQKVTAQDLKRAGDAILQVAKDLTLGGILDIARIDGARIVQSVLINSQASDDFNRALFSGIEIRNKLEDLGISLSPGWALDVSNEHIPQLLAGIVLSSSIRNPIRSNFILSEYNKAGQQIADSIADATAKIYLLLTGDWRNIFSSGISDLRDQTQVSRTLSYLIAANMSSDVNPIIGAYNSARAINDHFSRRALVAISDRNILLLAGVIYESFIGLPTPQDLISEDFKESRLPQRPLTTLKLTKAPAAEQVADQLHHHKQNVHHLSQNQCQFIVKLIEAGLETGRDLEAPHIEELFTAISEKAKRRIGSDILRLDGFEEDSFDELKLGDRDSRVSTFDLLRAVQLQFEDSSSSSPYEGSYIKLVANILEELRQSILEQTAYAVPTDFYDEFDQPTLEELAQDLLCSYNDPQGSTEDKGEITSESMALHYDLTDCLEAMIFRLRSIASKCAGDD